MPLTTRSSPTITRANEAYAVREALKHAAAIEILAKLGKVERMPANKGGTIEWRRVRPFSAATTPLVEGVTPDMTNFAYDRVVTPLREYGMVVGLTNRLTELNEEPVLKDIGMACGENMVRTKEAILWGTLRGGTNVAYSGTATQRSEVVEPLSKSRQLNAVRFLKGQKATPVTSAVSSSPNYGSTGLRRAYVAVAHTDLQADIEAMDGFKDTSTYGTQSVISEWEIGSVGEVRYVLSPDLDPFRSAGGAAGGSVLSTNGTNADVYPIVYMGADAFGHVVIRGATSAEVTVIPPSDRTKEDPLGQRGVLGWRTWMSGIRLNEFWMLRLEVAASAL